MDRTIKQVFWLCLAALTGYLLIFPEVCLNNAVSFLTWGDYLIDYHSTFALTGFFYQGGLQLWDFFGQLPHMFYFVTHGMFQVPAILTAAVYIVGSPFADHSARFFYQVFAFVYPGSLLALRVVGIYLLLRRFSDDPWTLRAASVLGALLFSPAAFYFGTLYQSLFPLMMHFVLEYTLTAKRRYLGMGLLFLLLSFGQGMVHTCYLYLGINMLMVSCAIYSAILHRDKWHLWKGFFIKNSRALRMGGLFFLVLGLVIMGPYIYMQVMCMKDLDFDVSHSRLTGMWSIGHYFHGLMLDQSPPSDFFRRMLDFTFTPGRSFFLGYMVFFLSGLALTMSLDRRKWIFVMAVLLVWFLNFPKEGFSVGLIGHWVNVLTNPLKVMVRSYQTAINAFISYALLPLALMGWGVLKDLGRRPVSYWRLFLFAVFCAVFAANGSSAQPVIVQHYFAASMFFSLTAMALLIATPHRAYCGRLAQWILLALLLTDASLAAWQMKHYFKEYCSLRPHFVEVLPAEEGAVGLDFRNPKVLPFVNKTDSYDMGDQSYLWTLADLSLNFNTHINRQKSIEGAGFETARHVSFMGWQKNASMKAFLDQNDDLFFFAPYAVQQGPGVFEHMLRGGLARDVLMVDGTGPSIGNAIPASIRPRTPEPDQWMSVVKEIRDSWPGWAHEKAMAVWDFPVGGEFPGYFATDIMAHDKWVKFFIQSRDQNYAELSQAQGQLVRPMTYDVQNIKEGKVYVALPAEQSYKGFKGVLLFKMRDKSGITSVWRHTGDETGINFWAPSDGWLGIQYPFDPKWRIEVDGKPASFWRADQSFIGVPLSRGEHRILIRYWPDSWLRWGLPLSATVTFILFILLIIAALYA